METETQCKLVLDYLKSHVGITQYVASDELGVARLASRICDLKHKGIKIVDLWVKVPNRYGKQSRVKEYRLVKGE